MVKSILGGFMVGAMDAFSKVAESGMRNRPQADPLSKDKRPSGYKIGELAQFSPEQLELFRNLFSQIGPESDIFKLASGDQSYFDEMEAPAHRQFQEQLGGLASRFSGMGMGARQGSGFQNAATQGASDFAQALRSNRMQMSQQALQQLMQMSQMLLGQRPVERGFFEKQQKPGSGQQIAGIIGTGVGAAGNAFFGGAPAAAGAAGSALNNAMPAAGQGYSWANL
jgi:hypothetical protein